MKATHRKGGSRNTQKLQASKFSLWLFAIVYKGNQPERISSYLKMTSKCGDAVQSHDKFTFELLLLRKSVGTIRKHKALFALCLTTS